MLLYIVIVFNSGLNEEVIVTITEKVTLTNPYIIFVFENDTTFDKQACLVGSDGSAYPERHNKYSITLIADPEPLLAEVNLQRGDGKYWIYEIADINDFNFTTIDTTGLNELENGKYRFDLATTSIPTYATTPPTKYIYNG